MKEMIIVQIFLNDTFYDNVRYFTSDFYNVKVGDSIDIDDNEYEVTKIDDINFIIYIID